VERLVKERLVGAAVLMAAAIILIPEMLSGPDRCSHAQPAADKTRGDVPIKTYTIDLSQPRQAPPAAVVENRAPPPEESAVSQTPEAQPSPGDQAKPEVSQQSAEVTAQAQPQPAAPPSQPVIEQPTAAASTGRTPQRPLASDSEAPTSGRWAVQVGTFSKEANAQRLAKQLRDQGQTAFVMPVKSAGVTLYRVRIGPWQDRASAEAALRELKTSGAKVVSNP
jgi:DedD protein